jgi:hypothetical protein
VKLAISPRWGIRIFALWSIVLAVLSASRLLILSESVELYSNLYSNQAQVWLIFLINVGFALSFSVGAYGLWQQQPWGRMLFLWSIGVWTVVNLVSVLAPNLLLTSVQKPIVDLAVDVIRYAVALFIPLVYLNLPHIKSCFATQSVDTL